MVPRRGDWTEVVAFLFDAGAVSTSATDLTFQAREVRGASFVSLDEGERLMTRWEYGEWWPRCEPGHAVRGLGGGQTKDAAGGPIAGRPVG